MTDNDAGLAISGGVDSMALAWLCSAMKKRGTHDYDFTAFVVDHKLRQGSTEEAAQVSKALAGLGALHLASAWHLLTPVRQVCGLAS